MCLVYCYKLKDFLLRRKADRNILRILWRHFFDRTSEQKLLEMGWDRDYLYPRSPFLSCKFPLFLWFREISTLNNGSYTRTLIIHPKNIVDFTNHWFLYGYSLFNIGLRILNADINNRNTWHFKSYGIRFYCNTDIL